MLFTLSGRVFHSNAQLTANTKGIAAAVGIAFFGGNTQLNNGVSALSSQSILAQHQRVGVAILGMTHYNHIVNTGGHAIV